MGSEDTTISSNWIAHSHNIDYTLNGGSNGENAPTIADYGNVIKITRPTKTGYTFPGWTITGINVGTAKYGNSQTNITTLIGICFTKSTYLKIYTIGANIDSILLNSTFNDFPIELINKLTDNEIILNMDRILCF